MPYQNIRLLRIFHVSLMLSGAFFISMCLQWPHAYWVPVTVIAVMLPLDSGLIIKRANERYIGTIMGLVLAIPAWFILNVDYRLFFLLAPLAVALLNFYQNFDYSKSVAFLTLSLGFVEGYLFSSNLTFFQFLMDRFAATFIGVGICILCEYLIFYRYKYSYYDLKYVVADIVNLLQNSIITLKQDVFRQDIKLEIYEKLLKFNQELLFLRDRKKSVASEYKNDTETSRYLDEFSYQVDSFRLTLIAAYYLLDSSNQNQIYEFNAYIVKLNTKLDNLKHLIKVLKLDIL